MNINGRFVYVTDLHVRALCPRRRKDEWPGVPLDKVRQVVAIAKEFDATVLCGGDIFDGPRPSIEVLAGFILAARGVEWHMTIGNHDEVGHAVKTYRSGALGIIEQLSWFHILGGMDGDVWTYVLADKTPIRTDRGPGHEITPRGAIKLRAFHYQHGTDTRSEYLVDPDDDDAIKVAIPHAMIVESERPFPHVLRDDVDTDAHFVLCSHSHGGWPPWQRDDGVWFLHPGAMCRLSIDDSKRQPGVYLLDLGADPVGVSWRPLEAGGAEVFDYTTAEETKTWDQRIGHFLARMEQGVAGGMDLTWRIEKVAEETGLEPEVLDEIRNRIVLREAEACR